MNEKANMLVTFHYELLLIEIVRELFFSHLRFFQT